MSLHRKPKPHRLSVLLLASLGISGSWWLWRRFSKPRKACVGNQRNDPSKHRVAPEWRPNAPADQQAHAESQAITTTPTCVLSHTYVAPNARETCTPNHWHATYWLHFITLVEREPLQAIVQHTDTQHYHVMVQLPGDDPRSCNDCCATQEVFRVPVQDHYRYFVFALHHHLDGFLTIRQAQEAARSFPIPGELRQLLPPP